MGILVDEAQAAGPVAQFAGQRGVVELRAVTEVGKLGVEVAGVEILIDAGRIEPLVTDTARDVGIELLHAIVIGLVVHNAFEFFLSQSAVGVHRVGNVSRGYGRLGGGHESDLAQTGIAAPVRSELVDGRGVHSRQTVLVDINIFGGETNLDLAWLVRIRSVQHNVALVALLRRRDSVLRLHLPCSVVVSPRRRSRRSGHNGEEKQSVNGSLFHSFVFLNVVLVLSRPVETHRPLPMLAPRTRLLALAIQKYKTFLIFTSISRIYYEIFIHTIFVRCKTGFCTIFLDKSFAVLPLLRPMCAKR